MSALFSFSDFVCDCPKRRIFKIGSLQREDYKKRTRIVKEKLIVIGHISIYNIVTILKTVSMI